MKKTLIYFLIAIILISVCSCKVKPQSDDEIAKVAASSTEQQQDTNNTQETTDITYGETEAATNEQTEKSETITVTLTDATQEYLDIINDKKSTENTSKQLPSDKDFEIDGKTVKLTFKEKTYITKLAFCRYDYTDAEGNIYYFHENDGFIGFYNPNRPDKSISVAITEDEALEIAKNYAGKLFADEFYEYTIYSDYVYNAYSMPVYHFNFSKKYGADNSLHGEICSVEVYENGTVKECSIDGLYAFEDFDPSLVNGITKEAVDKVLLDTLSEQYDNFDDYKITIDGYELLRYKTDKWVIALSVTFEHTTSAPFADTYFLEIN